MPHVTVLIPTYNRVELLRRSLWLLDNQTHDDYGIWVLDDGSTENILGVCKEFEHVYYASIRAAGAPARSPNMAWRHGYEMCNENDFVILSHPEVMVPLNAIELMLDGRVPPRRSVPVQYCISGYEQQNRLDQVDWKHDLSEIKRLPNFWSRTGPWHYTNQIAQQYQHHLSFSGQSKIEWDITDFLPLVEDPNFQSDDSWLIAKEGELGKLPRQLPEIEVYHQHHEKIYGTIEELSAKRKRIIESDKEVAKTWVPAC